MTNVALKLEDLGFSREQIDALTEFMSGGTKYKVCMAQVLAHALNAATLANRKA